MQEITLNDKVGDIVLALGFFDCVHKGHKKLLDIVAKNAKELNASSCVFTFSNNPFNTLNKSYSLINTYGERKKIFKDLGLDYVLPFVFDKDTQNTDPTKFLDNLTNNLAIKCIVCGYDYAFGKNGAGNTELLASYCKKNNIKLVIMDKFLIDNKRVSSTAIKEQLVLGNVKNASKLLGDNYFIDGTVVAGRGDGSKYRFPTANLKFDNSKLLVKSGVYKTIITIGSSEYRAVTNVGQKPTFDDYSLTIESLLADFNDDIYGCSITVEFVDFIRDIVKFSSPEQLFNQIQDDLSK